MEVEAKFSVPDPAVFRRLLAVQTLAGLAAGPNKIKQVHDLYLDTADRAFLRSGFACRIRTSDNHKLATLKSLGAAYGALHSRIELETPLRPAAGHEIASWPAGEAKRLAQQISGGAPLGQLFQVWQERHVRLLREPGDPQPVIELSLDHVRLNRSAGSVFFELEAELLPAGRMEALLALIAVLQTDWQLAPERCSKFERGLAQADPTLLSFLTVDPVLHKAAVDQTQPHLSG